MRTIAPLNAMRAFEAAARTGSFTKAARELRVSSAAISQQVKLLEDFWQELLFIRQGNRISLTDAGQTAYPQLAHAISTLGEVSGRMQRKQQGQKRLTLSAPQSVAETWLAARIARLPDAVAEVPLSLRVDDDPIDFVRDKVDMRIFFGHDLYGDYRVERLFADVLIAVASPAFIARNGAAPDTLDDRLFIHTDWGRGFASSPDWASALMGQRLLDHRVGLLVQSSSTALNFVRHGGGAALIPARMVADDLAAKRVMRMDLAPIPLQQDYSIAYPKRLRNNPQIRGIVEALRTEQDPF